MASTTSISAQIDEDLLVGQPVGFSHNFLSLAPTTSTSYPLCRKTKPAVEAPKASIVEDITLATISVPSVSGQEMLNASRSSSMSSEASNASPNQRKRFLKLGPVHDGEHVDEKGDWSEEVIIG